MRQVVLALFGAVLVSSVVACAPMANSGRADTTTAPNAAAAMPQSPNSLPPGDRVNAPLASPTGTVGRY